MRALLAEKVREGRDLDYKRQLPGKASGEKKEFLKDVSSFANAAGGFLIYGMEEKDGEPEELVGISAENSEGEILRLASIIQTGVQPRIPGVRTKSIALQNGKDRLRDTNSTKLGSSTQGNFRGAQRVLVAQLQRQG